MNIGLQRIVRVPGIAALAFFTALILPLASAAQQSAPENTARRIGTIKAITGKTITLKADSGPDVNVVIQDSTRLAQLPAGQTGIVAEEIPVAMVVAAEAREVRVAGASVVQEDPEGLLAVSPVPRTGLTISLLAFPLAICSTT